MQDERHHQLKCQRNKHCHCMGDFVYCWFGYTLDFSDNKFRSSCDVWICCAVCCPLFLDNGFVRSNQKTIAVCDDVICGFGMVGADWIVAVFCQFYDHNVFI